LRQDFVGRAFNVVLKIDFDPRRAGHIGDVELVAAITRGSAEALNLKAGDAVKAVIKATEVLIDKP